MVNTVRTDSECLVINTCIVHQTKKDHEPNPVKSNTTDDGIKKKLFSTDE